MANRIIKYTPIAASVALTLSLAGCGSDNDNVYTKPTPVTVYNAEVTTSFNTKVSGKAVKGSLKNATVTVTTLNDAGENVPVAYRLAAADESFTAESTTSQADADASAQAKIVASNPEAVMTASNGGYTLFIEDSFTGPLHITVATVKEGDDSFVRCDSLLGCGAYETVPAASEDETMVNNGDTDIDFGEWYKDDLALQVVKFISPSETAAQSKGPSARFADGDNASAKSYAANATFYTSVAAKLLLDSAADGTAVSDEEVAAASLKTLIQIVGPSAALKASALIGDISNGGAVDFTDINEGDSLDAGTLALMQTAVSLQTLAGTGSNGSLSSLISSLSSAVKTGKVANNDDDVIKKIATELQKAVENTSLIFSAVISGEGVDEAFAKVAENMGVTDPAAIEKLKAKATKAVDEVKAKAKKAGVDKDLNKTAKDVKDALKKIGCTDDCDVGEDFDAKLASELTAELVLTQAFIDEVAPQVEMAATALETVVALGDAGLETADQVKAFSNAVFDVSSNLPKYNDWVVNIEATLAKASGIVKSAQALAAKNAVYAQVLTDAQNIEADLETGLAEVNAIVTGVEAQVVRANDAVSALGLELEIAIVNATAATENLTVAQSAADTASIESTSAVMAVEQAVYGNAEEAMAAIEVANLALAAAQMLANNADALELAATAGVSAATVLSAIAVEDTDVTLASTLAESSTLSLTSASTLSIQAADDSAKAQTLLDEATMAAQKFEFLVQVKADTASISNVSLATKTGGKAAFNVGEMVYDVLDEAYDLGDEAKDVVSTRYPEWTYSFNKTNQGEERLFLTLTHEDEEQFVELKGEYLYDSSKTEAPARLALAYKGYLAVDVLDDNDEVLRTVMATLGNENDDLSVVAADCLAGNMQPGDTCTVFDFSADVSFDDIFDSTLASVQSWNEVAYTDGDTGFTGTVTLSGDDMSEMGNITASGMAGELDFTAMLWLDDSTEDETYGVEINLHNEINYKIEMSASDSDDVFKGSVTANYNEMMMKFGTVTEITNGISVTYIDGEVIDYTDISFLDEAK